MLEIIINGMMVAEVSTRWVAYGKVSRLLLMVVMADAAAEIPNDDPERAGSLACRLLFPHPYSRLHQTMLRRHKRYVVIDSTCEQRLTCTEEEIFDTILLVIRNAVQFLRLGNILRR